MTAKMMKYRDQYGALCSIMRIFTKDGKMLKPTIVGYVKVDVRTTAYVAQFKNGLFRFPVNGGKVRAFELAKNETYEERTI